MTPSQLGCLTWIWRQFWEHLQWTPTHHVVTSSQPSKSFGLLTLLGSVTISDSPKDLMDQPTQYFKMDQARLWTQHLVD